MTTNEQPAPRNLDQYEVISLACACLTELISDTEQPIRTTLATTLSYWDLTPEDSENVLVAAVGLASIGLRQIETAFPGWWERCCRHLAVNGIAR